MMATQREIFPIEENKYPDSIQLGNGYSIIKNKNLIQVFRYGVLYKTVDISDATAKRLLIVELVQDCGCKKNKVSEGFKISRQSIDNYLDYVKHYGIEGLIHSYRGHSSKYRARKKNKEKLLKVDKAKEMQELRRRKREKEKEEADRQIDLFELFKVESSEIVEETKGISETKAFSGCCDWRESRYSGSMLFWAIWQSQWRFMEKVEGILGYTADIMWIFAMMVVTKIPSIEQLKTVFHKEFGVITGGERLPSKPKIWQMVKLAAQMKKSMLLLEDIFLQQVRAGIVNLYLLFVDGHFIPYYGKEKVHKGYCTQRSIAMPGQTNLMVHDMSGRIVYFRIEEGKGDIKAMVGEMGKKVRPFLDGLSPLLVCDTEVWGVEYFAGLITEGLKFVTWEKYTDREDVDKIPEERFGLPWTLNEKEYRIIEEERSYHSSDKKTEVTLRRIIIWNLGSNKRSVAVAYDPYENGEFIARAMLSRWGNNENGFKYEKEWFNLNYQPGHTIEEESKEQTIANPRIPELRKEIKQIKNERDKIERRLGKIIPRVNKDGQLKKNKNCERLQSELKVIEDRIVTLQKELKGCSMRVPITDIKGDEYYKKIETEGKNLFDIAQMLAFNGKKELADMLRNHYSDDRDRLKILDAITRTKGWVKVTKKEVIVRLEPLERPLYRSAQIGLCCELNHLKPHFANGKCLIFEVGESPLKMSKNLVVKG